MDTASNKRIVEDIFNSLTEGDGKPFVDAMTDDFTWTIAGHGPWARTWRGKADVRRGLLAPLFAQFAGTYRNRALRMIAEGPMIAVECRGEVMTKTGRRYDNHYCYLIEMRKGRMHALTEYMDTALAQAVLTAPA